MRPPWDTKMAPISRAWLKVQVYLQALFKHGVGGGGGGGGYPVRFRLP